MNLPVCACVLVCELYGCVCVCGGQGTRQGVVSFPAAPVTWNKSSVVGRSCDCVCVCVCVFHPCHVIWAQGRLWEVLTRCERFLPPRQQADSEHAGRRRRWMDGCHTERRCGSQAETQKRAEKLPLLSLLPRLILSFPRVSLWIFNQQPSKDAKPAFWFTSTFLWQSRFGLFFLF